MLSGGNRNGEHASHTDVMISMTQSMGDQQLPEDGQMPHSI